MGFKGPRKMTVIIPGMLSESKRKEVRPEVEQDCLLGKFINPIPKDCVWETPKVARELTFPPLETIVYPPGSPVADP